MSAPHTAPSDSISPRAELIAFTNARYLMIQASSMFAALALATFVCYVLEVPHGLGKHLTVVQMDKIAYRELLKIREIHMCCVTIELSVVKISVSSLFLRLATKKAYRVFLWGFVVFMVAYAIASAGTLIFQCIPVQTGWDLRLRPPPVGHGSASCFSRKVLAQIGLLNSAFNIATDFLLALLAILLIWQLQARLRTKIFLVAILSLGFFACVAGIMKSTYNKITLTDPRRSIHDSYSMWNFIELDVGIIAASLPALKPLFASIFVAAKGMTSRQNEGVSSYRHRTGPLNSETRPSFREEGTRASLSKLAAWNVDGARGSEDSILPLQHLPGRPEGTTATRDFRVEQR